MADRTWNAYTIAITSPAQSDDLYAEHLLNLACELIHELNPAHCTASVLVELQKLALSREEWPGFISKRKSIIERGKKQCSALNLGGNDRRKKKQPKRQKPTKRAIDEGGKSTSGVLANVATMLLNKVWEYAARVPVKAWPHQRKYWDFHYLRKQPPSFDSTDFWVKFAEVILDKEHGPRSIRAEARRKHFEESKNNLHQVEIPGSQSKKSDGTKAKTKQEIPNGNQVWAIYKNEIIIKPKVVTGMLKKPEANDQRIAKANHPDAAVGKDSGHWSYEPAPCILADPEVHEYVRHLADRPKNRKPQQDIYSPEAAYKQFKKDVLRAVRKRLGKPKQA